MPWAGDFALSRFPRQFENLDNLAQLELEKLKAKQNEPQIKLSEILLQPTPNRPIEKTSELANKIIEALGQNANFPSIASQYSEAATASQGRRVRSGLRVSQLPPVLRSSLNEADEGDIIGPLVLWMGGYISEKGWLPRKWPGRSKSCQADVGSRSNAADQRGR